MGSRLPRVAQMTARFAWLGALVFVFLTSSREARAHPVGLSQGEYVLEEERLYAGVTFARRELADAFPWLRRDDEASMLAFEENKDRLGAWLVEALVVSTPSGSCRGAFAGMRFDGDGVALALSYTCPARPSGIELDARFVSELERRHRHVAVFSTGGERHDAVATRERTSLPFGETSRSLFAPLLRMGIEHILTGYDHLLFLLGLVLIGGPIRSLVGAITAFTVAHSITLGLAALGVWAPSARIVEPGIALSIAYVAVENWFARDAKGRWRITLLFGLVHGFGFAGALREIALSPSEIPTALFAFNFGVEIGQIAVLAIVFPLVLLAHKKYMSDRVAMRACNVALALAGIAWFVVRLRNSI